MFYIVRFDKYITLGATLDPVYTTEYTRFDCNDNLGIHMGL